jgi:serine/threonine protein phosphatase PrpC
MTAVLTKERAPAVVQAAVAECDAIQANLLELDGSFGKRLLEGAALSGDTKRRWEATAASLANLWQIYSVYSPVIDRAAETVNGHLGPRELAVITNLLAGPSIQLAAGPAPLAGRDLADSGREDLTVVAAVTRMRRAFGQITEVVTAAEQVWNEMTGRLDAVAAELSRVIPLAATLADEALTGNLAAARSELARLRGTLSSDPLSLWPGGPAAAAAVDTSGADRLQERVATASTRVDELVRLRDDGQQRITEATAAAAAARAAYEDAAAAWQRAAAKIAAEALPVQPAGLADVTARLADLDVLGGVRRIDSDEAIYGTVGYQAPEIEADGPSPSSDLYTVGRSLAVLTFEFRGFQGTYKYTLPDGVPLLGEQESLARLLRRATHRDPGRRFASAGEMAEQLTGVLREVLAVADGVPRPAFSTIFSPEVQAIGTGAEPAPADSWAPPGRAARLAPPPGAEVVAWLPLPQVDRSDPAAGYLATFAGLSPAQRIAALTLAVTGDATIPREVTESAETRLALARARIDAGDYDAAAVVLADLAADYPTDWRVAWYNGLRGLAAKGPGGAQIAQGAFSAVYDELPGELAPKLALAFAAEAAGDLTTAGRYFRLVWTVDRSYISAAFGMARTCLAAGDRPGAIAALAAVPVASSHYAAAQIAAMRILVSSDSQAGVTDRGLKHARNEDAMALATADAPGGPVAIAVVCDGVSTSPRPDDASLAGAQASVRALLTSARRGEDPAEASLAAVRSAHQALTRIGSPGEAPSATYISAVIGSDAVTVCWLGDSRAYWLSMGPDVVRLSTDDSLEQEMVAGGAMGEAEALASPQAHVITRWLGADLAEPEPHVVQFEPSGPGVVLVCSDGLWNYRPEAAGLAELALLAAFADPLGAASQLVKFALDSGGMDNITVVLAPFPLAPFPLAPFPEEPPHPKTVPVRRQATLPRRTRP